MKRTTLRVLLFSSLFVFSVASIAQSETDLKQKIEKMNKEMAQAMIAGDHEKNLQYYTDDVVSLPSYEKMINGKEGIKKSMDEMAKSGWKIKDFNFETVSVETHGDIITEIGKYRMEMTKEGTDMSEKDEGKYITMWEKQADGSLKIKTEMWNTDKNPWAEMAEANKKNNQMMGESKMKDNENIDDHHNNESNTNKDNRNMDNNNMNRDDMNKDNKMNDTK